MNVELVTLRIEEAELVVVEMSGLERLSTQFTFLLVCEAPASVHSGRLVGRRAEISLGAHGALRVVRGVVARAKRTISDDGVARVELTVRPEAFRLTLGRDCRAFQHSTTPAIVDAVLGAVPHRWELSREYDAREYTAQYREDDWTFAARLLEEEGIFYWFDHEEASQLVLGDRSSAAADLEGGAVLPFALDPGLVEDREHVTELASEARGTATRFTVASFDPRHPRLPVGASAGEGSLETYDAPGAGPRSPSACARRAADWREAAVAAARGVAGRTSSVRVVPGRVLEIEGHPIASYDARYVVTEVTYRWGRQEARPGAEGDERRLECRFRAIPRDVPFRPERQAPLAKQAGLQSGVVIGAPGEEIFPDPEGRVRVQLHWDRLGARDASAGRWVRVAQRGTADSMLLPRVGWNVMTFNEEGAVDEPAVLSRFHDAEHPPAYPLPANKTQVVFKTATSPGEGTFNEIRFEDKKGAEEMFMNASRDLSVLVHNEKTEQVVRDVHRHVGHSRDLGVGANLNETIEGNQTVRVAGDEATNIVGGRQKRVGGNESETIGSSRDLEVGDAHQIAVTGARSLSVGAVMMDATLGPIAATAGTTHSVLVGGAAIKVSAKSIAETVELASIQTIGGAKLEMAGGARSIQAKLVFAETVGGAMVLTTAKEFKATSKIGSMFTVGGLFSTLAPTLLVEGQEKVRLVCGSSSITVTPTEIEIAGPAFDLSSADMLDADAGRIDHN